MAQRLTTDLESTKLLVIGPILFSWSAQNLSSHEIYIISDAIKIQIIKHKRTYNIENEKIVLIYLEQSRI